MTLLALLFSLLCMPTFAGNKGYEPAAASPEVRAAEHSRLSSEIRSLARKSAWKGVDQAYDRISLLRVEMSWEDHVYGAHASSELGDIAQTRARLFAAVQLRPEKGLIDWLWSLDQSYGSVRLQGPAGSHLEASVLPLDPAQRRAIELAVERCAQTGIFEGLLPVGVYTFETHELRIEAGEEITVELAMPEPRRWRIRAAH